MLWNTYNGVKVLKKSFYIFTFYIFQLIIMVSAEMAAGEKAVENNQKLSTAQT